MEFDKNTPASDEQRRLAESKKLTLEPMHADLSPDDVSDSEIASRHLVEPAIGNTANDTEQNSASIRPAPGPDAPVPTPRRTSLAQLAVIILSIGLVVAAGIVFFTR